MITIVFYYSIKEVSSPVQSLTFKAELVEFGGKVTHGALVLTAQAESLHSLQQIRHHVMNDLSICKYFFQLQHFWIQSATHSVPLLTRPVGNRRCVLNAMLKKRYEMKIKHVNLF